jgi:hypothetical protein
MPRKIRQRPIALPKVTPAQWRAVSEFAAAWDRLPPVVRLRLLQTGQADAAALKNLRDHA